MSQHRRGRSAGSISFLGDDPLLGRPRPERRQQQRQQPADEDLALFHEMRSRECEEFLHPSRDDIEASLTTRFGGISRSRRPGDLLGLEPDKNDYDWLLTPPGTPLFTSLEDTPAVPAEIRGSLGRPSSSSKAIGRSSSLRPVRGNASPQRPSSPSAQRGTHARNSSPARPSSPRGGSRPATPTRPTSRPSSPTAAARPSTPTRRTLTTSASFGSAVTNPRRNARSSSPAAKRYPIVHPAMASLSTEPPPNLRTSIDRPTSNPRGSSLSPRPASRSTTAASQHLSESVDFVGRNRRAVSPSLSRSSSTSSSRSGSVISSQSSGIEVNRPAPLKLNAKKSGGPELTSPAKLKSPGSSRKPHDSPSGRQMDYRRTSTNGFRPLMSNSHISSFYHRASISLQSRSLQATLSSSFNSSDRETERETDHEDEAISFKHEAESLFGDKDMDAAEFIDKQEMVDLDMQVLEDQNMLATEGSRVLETPPCSSQASDHKVHVCNGTGPDVGDIFMEEPEATGHEVEQPRKAVALEQVDAHNSSSADAEMAPTTEGNEPEAVDIEKSSDEAPDISSPGGRDLNACGDRAEEFKERHKDDSGDFQEAAEIFEEQADTKENLQETTEFREQAPEQATAQTETSVSVSSNNSLTRDGAADSSSANATEKQDQVQTADNANVHVLPDRDDDGVQSETVTDPHSLDAVATVQAGDRLETEYIQSQVNSSDGTDKNSLMSSAEAAFPRSHIENPLDAEGSVQVPVEDHYARQESVKNVASVLELIMEEALQWAVAQQEEKHELASSTRHEVVKPFGADEGEAVDREADHARPQRLQPGGDPARLRADDESLNVGGMEAAQGGKDVPQAGASTSRSVKATEAEVPKAAVERPLRKAGSKGKHLGVKAPGAGKLEVFEALVRRPRGVKAGEAGKLEVATRKLLAKTGNLEVPEERPLPETKSLEVATADRILPEAGSVGDREADLLQVSEAECLRAQGDLPQSREDLQGISGAVKVFEADDQLPASEHGSRESVKIASTDDRRDANQEICLEAGKGRRGRVNKMPESSEADGMRPVEADWRNPENVEADGRPENVEADGRKPVEADWRNPENVEADGRRPVEADWGNAENVEADGGPENVEADGRRPEKVEADDGRSAKLAADDGRSAKLAADDGRSANFVANEPRPGQAAENILKAPEAAATDDRRLVDLESVEANWQKPQPSTNERTCSLEVPDVSSPERSGASSATLEVETARQSPDSVERLQTMKVPEPEANEKPSAESCKKADESGSKITEGSDEPESLKGTGERVETLNVATRTPATIRVSEADDRPDCSNTEAAGEAKNLEANNKAECFTEILSPKYSSSLMEVYQFDQLLHSKVSQVESMGSPESNKQEASLDQDLSRSLKPTTRDSAKHFGTSLSRKKDQLAKAASFTTPMNSSKGGASLSSRPFSTDDSHSSLDTPRSFRDDDVKSEDNYVDYYIVEPGSRAEVQPGDECSMVPEVVRGQQEDYEIPTTGSFEPEDDCFVDYYIDDLSSTQAAGTTQSGHTKQAAEKTVAVVEKQPLSKLQLNKRDVDQDDDDEYDAMVECWKQQEEAASLGPEEDSNTAVEEDQQHQTGNPVAETPAEDNSKALAIVPFTPDGNLVGGRSMLQRPSLTYLQAEQQQQQQMKIDALALVQQPQWQQLQQQHQQVDHIIPEHHFIDWTTFSQEKEKRAPKARCACTIL